MAKQNGKFRVTRYQVSITQDKANPRGLLTMFGKADPSGTIPVEQAAIYFRDVTYTALGNIGGNLVTASLPRDEFSHYYEILHNEDPVWVGWEADDGPKPNDPNPLTALSISSDDLEKPGEIE